LKNINDVLQLSMFCVLVYFLDFVVACDVIWNSLLGFKPAKHMVFSGLYPADGSDFEALSHAIEKLTCNDASVSVTKETSNALGMGFRY
jgi:translation elongation factor EF-4